MKKKDKQRYIKYPFGYKQEATEEEYVDHKFKMLSESVKALNAELDVLKTLNQREYTFIDEDRTYSIPNTNEVIHEAKEAREWATKNGYRYIKPIKSLGELWVKEKNNG